MRVERRTIIGVCAKLFSAIENIKIIALYVSEEILSTNFIYADLWAKNKMINISDAKME